MGFIRNLGSDKYREDNLCLLIMHKFKESKMKHQEYFLLGNGKPDTFTGPSQIRIETTGFMERFHEAKRNGYQQSWPHQVVSSLLFLSSCLKI